TGKVTAARVETAGGLVAGAVSAPTPTPTATPAETAAECLADQQATEKRPAAPAAEETAGVRAVVGRRGPPRHRATTGNHEASVGIVAVCERVGVGGAHRHAARNAAGWLPLDVGDARAVSGVEEARRPTFGQWLAGQPGPHAAEPPAALLERVGHGREVLRPLRLLENCLR